MKAPDFWEKNNILSYLLYPISKIYGAFIDYYNRLIQPWKPTVPVICIGNVVVGGAGKTPIAIDIGGRLKDLGFAVHFLTRGYGGRLKGPTQVELNCHSSYEVGDEPLLLARIAPTWVARNRVSGAKAAIKAGAEVLVMDDGFQNLYIEKDLSFLVIDGEYKFGNGRLIPSGPMREPLCRALSRTDVAVIMGGKKTGELENSINKPVLRSQVVPGSEISQFLNCRIAAFSGIGRPKKFFEMLKSYGLKLVFTREFPDHHQYTKKEIKKLKQKAIDSNAVLVSTEKDVIRLPKSYQEGILPIKIMVDWEDKLKVENLLKTTLEKN